MLKVSDSNQLPDEMEKELLPTFEDPRSASFHGRCCKSSELIYQPQPCKHIIKRTSTLQRFLFEILETKHSAWEYCKRTILHSSS